MSGDKILVTGGTGCIGEFAINILANAGWEVHSTYQNNKCSYLKNINWHKTDLLRPGAPQELINKIKPQYLLHIAWAPAHHWNGQYSSEQLAWARATLDLVQSFSASGGQKAVCVGSCAEYEWNKTRAITELDNRKPQNIYGTVKSLTGEMLSAYSVEENFDLAWARIFFVYGGRENHSRLVPSIILKLLRDEPAETSTGAQVRDFLYAEDIADALCSLLKSNITGPINIGSGQGTSVADMARTIGELTNRSDLLRIGALPSNNDEISSIIADTSLLKKSGWSPKHSVREGLMKTISYWKKNI